MTDDAAVEEFERAMAADAGPVLAHRDPFTGQQTDVALEQPGPSLLERLQASVAAAQGEQLPEAVAAREAAAWAHLRDFVAWVNDGSAVMAALWDAVPDADSIGLVDLLRLLTNREAGLLPALAMLQRHVETSLGERHGRTAIMDGDVAVAAVERSAASTKWNVDDAWPSIAQGIRKADRLPIGDPEDGELEDDVAKTLRLVKQLCGVSYLRVGPCEELGLDPEDFRTKSGYRWVVKLP